MSTTTYDFAKTQTLGKEREQLLGKAHTIIDGASNAGRDLTPVEQEQVSAAFDRIKEIDVERKAQSKAAVKSVLDLGGGANVDPDLGDGPFDAEAVDGFLHAIRSKTGYRATVQRADLSTKAAITGAFLPTSGQAVAPALYPNAMPIAVTDLMQTVPAPGPTVRYYRIGAGTAAVVAEGAKKPDAGIAAVPVDVALAKIAATMEVTDELSEDAPFMPVALQQALVGAVVSKENEEVVSTLGATPGILTKNGTAADAVDVFADAIAGMQSLGTNPSAILVTPSALATIRKTKSDSAGTYVADPLSSGPTTLHGIPLYAVPVAGEGTGWVIDGSGLAYYRRSQVTFELGYDSDSWSRNVRMARAETRGKAAVLQPYAVTKVTLA